MRVQSPLLWSFLPVNLQTPAHPGNGNGGPGPGSSPPPSHGAKQDKSGPSVLRYTIRNVRLSVISGGWWSVLLFLLFFSSICRVLLHLHGGSDQRSGARWLHLWLHGLLYKDGNIKPAHCVAATSKWFMYQTQLDFIVRESLTWAIPMLWWCHTGKALFTMPSSSLSSIACSEGTPQFLSVMCSLNKPIDESVLLFQEVLP